MKSELTYTDLWQPAMDIVWNAISSFIVGKSNRGDAPPCKYSEIFMSGGRGSGKSYSVALWIIMALMNDHNKNACVIRKVGSTIRKSCFRQVCKAIRKLGVSKFWTINKTDLTITHNITKQQIIFLGLDDEDKVRSVTTEVGYFSIVWLEEARQFKGMEEIRQAIASVIRGSEDDDDDDEEDEDEDKKDGNDEDDFGDAEFLTFFTFNPPKSTTEWINKESRKTLPNRLVHHSTYLTMPKKWLGKGFLAAAESLKLSDPEAYEHQYLGKATGTGRKYFTKVEYREITDEEIATFEYCNMGVDFGSNDPNVFEQSYYDDDKDTIYCYGEVYQAGRNDGAVITKDRYEQFARKIKKKIGEEYLLDEIFCDAQGKAEMMILAKEGLNPVEAEKHGKMGRIMRYAWLRSKTIVCDPKRCPHLAEALELFEAKEKDGMLTDEPNDRDDHCPDALGYSYNDEIKAEHPYSDI